MIIKRRKPKVVDGTLTQEGNVHRSEELQGGMGCPSGQRILYNVHTPRELGERGPEYCRGD